MLDIKSYLKVVEILEDSNIIVVYLSPFSFSVALILNVDSFENLDFSRFIFGLFKKYENQ